MKISDFDIDEIKAICIKNNVKSLFAFGSVTREDFNDSSDIDMLVDFEEKDPFKYTDLYFSLKYRLEEIFKRKVDLIEERAIKNVYFRKELNSTKVQVYGQ